MFANIRSIMNSNPRPFVFLSMLDVCFVALIAFVLSIGTPAQAYAYVDPSVMTYTIQALAGVAVALSAVIGVAWRRFRRAIYKKLNIDENAGKLVEESVHRISPDSADAEKLLHEADRRAKESLYVLEDEHHQNTKWLPRFLLALISCLFLVYTIGIVAPLEIATSNVDSLQFGLNNVLTPLIVFALAISLISAGIISIMRGKLFNIVIGVIVALGVAAYIQALFMNSGLPTADGRPVLWDDYTTITLLSTIVWLFIIAVAVVLAVKRGNVLKTSAAIMSIVLILVQSIGLVTVFSDPALRSDGSSALDSKPFPTAEGLFEVGPDNNIVLFVLDTFDNDFMDAVVEDDPQILDEFTGFTWYQDCSGSMIPTPYGLPSLLTGRAPSMDAESFGIPDIEEWYGDDNIFDALHEKGYTVDLYTTQYSEDIDHLYAKSDNFVSVESVQASMPTVIRELWKCALYRDAPWVAKPLFWFYTGNVNTAILDDIESEAITPYTNDDVKYYQDLVNQGLEVVKNPVGEGSFKLIHLDGTHLPYTVNRNVERVEQSESNVVEQGIASLTIVSEYIEQLKELGVYDDTVIMVTADHGKWLSQQDILEPSSPIMLVKLAHEGEGQYAPIKISTAPVSHYEIAPTIIDLIGADASMYGSGIPFYDVPTESRSRYYYDTEVGVKNNNSAWLAIHEWIIDGDVQDWNVWKKTGREVPILEFMD